MRLWEGEQWVAKCKSCKKEIRSAWVTFHQGNAEEGYDPWTAYCYQCTDDSGEAKAGYVTTVTQNPSDVPYPGVKWWKVGQFVATGGSVAWETCNGQSCYKNSPVGPAPQVTVSFSASNVINPSESVSGISYEVYKGYPDVYMPDS